MISNPYTYFFLSALMIAYSLSLILRVILKRGRRKFWNHIFSSLLVLLVIAFVFLIISLIFSSTTVLDIKTVFLFYGLSALIVLPFAFFLKGLTFPLMAILLMAAFYFFQTSLSDFRSFGNNESIVFNVLKVEDGQVVLEVKKTGQSSEFYTLESEAMLPKVTVLEFPSFLFLLDNARVYRFDGFEDQEDVFTDLPAIPSIIYEVVQAPDLALDKAVMSRLEIEFLNSGEVAVIR